MLTLRDGAPVRIRSVRPDDRVRLQRGVREMSRTSRYMRFFASTREMTEEQARYFAEVDQIHHVAVCAVEPTEAEERGYGIARFVRQMDDPRSAEFAIAVIDEMQGRGLGTLLLAALYLRAQGLGVTELRAEILAENSVMPQWLPRLGASILNTEQPEYRLIRWAIAPCGASGLINDEGVSGFVIALERLRSHFGS